MNEEKQLKEEAKTLAKAKMAENLLASPDYKLVIERNKLVVSKIKDILSKGIKSDVDGQSWQEKYWEYVGKCNAIESQTKYLTNLIEKRDGIIKKRNTAKNG